jgi:hypothetical protein
MTASIQEMAQARKASLSAALAALPAAAALTAADALRFKVPASALNDLDSYLRELKLEEFATKIKSEGFVAPIELKSVSAEEARA